MYLLGAGSDKTAYQALDGAGLLVGERDQVAALPGDRHVHAAAARADLMLAPIAVLGVLLGVWAHAWIAETWFFRLTYALLLVTGGKLVFDALT